MRAHRNSGFTLIELMIVVAMVAILAAIAIPSFSAQIRKGRRAEAVSAMQDAQLKLERWRVDHSNFTGMPSPFPASSWYAFGITATAAAPNDYSITATPQGSQTQDDCGTLKITNVGGTISKLANDVSNPHCW